MSKTSPGKGESAGNQAYEFANTGQNIQPEMTGESADLIMGIPVEVQIVLGSTEMPVSELMALQKGSIVSLDRRLGEPVDIVVNGRRIARGEITLMDDDPSSFGVRLIEVGKAASAK